MKRLLIILGAVLAAATPAWADSLVPNDPYYGYEWYGPKLGLPQAWGYSLGSGSVVVAILDSGVMAKTPDLAGRLRPPLVSPGLALLDGTTCHHGTWVASVAGMGVNNGLGGAGVGNFTILPVVVTDWNGCTTDSWIVNGIRMAADAGARVINVSQYARDYGRLDAAAAYAKDKGALVFVAAGNGNSKNPMTGYDNLIFVSGTDSLDQRWDNGPGQEGSAWGPFVDLAAPAWHVLVADPTLPNGYGLGDGTSFAAPLAAGAAALAWSINPLLTPDEVYGILKETAVDLGTSEWDEVFGWGRIDIGAVAERANWTTGAPEPATLGLLAAGLVLWGAGRRVTRPR